MDWQDEGFIIGARRHGETSLILEVMTRGHGRHLGLVRGGRSRRAQPLLQPGNAVAVTWRARLEEHLGFFVVETTRLAAAALMARPASLHGLNLVASLLRLLPEREPYAALHDRAGDVLAALETAEPHAAAPRASDPRVATLDAGALLVRFELAVLAETGFGLDLERCAVTGARQGLDRQGLLRQDPVGQDPVGQDPVGQNSAGEDTVDEEPVGEDSVGEELVYVSPRSGRAVSRTAGQPWADRLLALPPFLLADDAAPEGGAPPTPADVEAGFALTGHFLRRDLYEPRGLPLPAARDAYLALLRRAEG